MVANLVQQTQQQGSITKGKKKTIQLPAVNQPQPIQNIPIPQELLQTGISERLMQVLVEKVPELMAIKEEARQLEYMMQIASHEMVEAGKEEARQEVDSALRKRETAKLKKQAQQWFDKVGEYYNSFLILGGYPNKNEAERKILKTETAERLISQAEKLHNIKLEISFEDKDQVVFRGVFSLDGSELE